MTLATARLDADTLREYADGELTEEELIAASRDEAEQRLRDAEVPATAD